ncbi:MAG TPA: hypothetical protein VMT71_02470 [Syntrophorhabdales bacterium]|nr:hypothetical protein [Syntrophorhabdales bacterium]
MKRNGKGSGRKETGKVHADQETQEIKKLWESMPEEARDELMRLAEETDSEDDFVRAVFVGDCPRCSSADTGMPDGPDGEEDLTVGVCGACGYIWCLECERELDAGAPCGHWAICESCDELEDESGICSTSPDECEVIQTWLSQKRS